MADTDIKREDVKRLVEVFYQPPFKTFYVNSSDGVTFENPTGVFVSLGITTTMKVLQNICDIINNSKEYKATLVEIKSIKVAGQFLNYVSSLDPKQIQIPNIEQGYKFLKSSEDPDKILDSTNSYKELESMKDLMYPDQEFKILQEYAPRIGSLETLIKQIESTPGTWENYWILKKSNGTYKLFHRYINYINCGDEEYRIGIYVTNK